MGFLNYGFLWSATSSARESSHCATPGDDTGDGKIGYIGTLGVDSSVNKPSNSLPVVFPSFVKTLETQGKTPYAGKDPIQPYSTLFGKEYAIFEVPNIMNEDFRRNRGIMMLMLKQPEYGWMDRIYYLLGLMNTFNVVYPQLQDLDLRENNT